MRILDFEWNQIHRKNTRIRSKALKIPGKLKLRTFHQLKFHPKYFNHSDYINP